ncbi:unnamed protein product [Blepharisma stoltei]|uniref:Uncharacterized protein n=1 Tax=Blepharisma stoltei TaxID=1481888 RepID=A0AAU9JBT7_9CILI|nr:unnamed protein product [Blepharisma stoltei]
MFLVLLVSVAFGQKCTLLPDSESIDPNPSLVKCYRQNGDACCVSAHDQNIQSVYTEAFPTQCQREYDNMEDYFCFGCHPSQGKYTFESNQTIYMCKDYAESIWGEKLTKPSSHYDNCGMYTYWRANPTTVMPSLEWKDGYAFFEEVKPPYFENYTIVIREHNCFNSSWEIKADVLIFCMLGWLMRFLI